MAIKTWKVIMSWVGMATYSAAITISMRLYRTFPGRITWTTISHSWSYSASVPCFVFIYGVCDHKKKDYPARLKLLRQDVKCKFIDPEVTNKVFTSPFLYWMKCASADPTKNVLAKLDYWEEDISNIEEKPMDYTNTDIISVLYVVRYQCISIVPCIHVGGSVMGVVYCYHSNE